MNLSHIPALFVLCVILKVIGFIHFSCLLGKPGPVDNPNSLFQLGRASHMGRHGLGPFRNRFPQAYHGTFRDVFHFNSEPIKKTIHYNPFFQKSEISFLQIGSVLYRANQKKGIPDHNPWFQVHSFVNVFESLQGQHRSLKINDVLKIAFDFSRTEAESATTGKKDLSKPV